MDAAYRFSAEAARRSMVARAGSDSKKAWPSGIYRDRLSILSFPRLFFCGLVKAHAGAPAVLIDELDAGGF